MAKKENTSSDHDLLITLSTRFDTFTQQYALDMKELKDGTAGKLVDHENRIKTVEKTISNVQLETSYKEFVQLKQQFHDFQTTAMVWRSIAGIGGGAAMWLLTQIPRWIELWWK
jgi:hypothetical protein